MTLYEINLINGTITPWQIPIDKAKRFENTLEFTDSEGVVRRLYKWIYADAEWKAVAYAKKCADEMAYQNDLVTKRLLAMQFKLQPQKK